jgi:hypothetical protein
MLAEKFLADAQGFVVVPGRTWHSLGEGLRRSPCAGASLLQGRRSGSYHGRNELVNIGLNRGSVRKLKRDTA